MAAACEYVGARARGRWAPRFRVQRAAEEEGASPGAAARGFGWAAAEGGAAAGQLVISTTALMHAGGKAAVDLHGALLRFVCAGGSSVAARLRGVDIGGHAAAQEVPVMALLYDGALLADTEFRGTLAAEVSAALGAPPADVERASLHEPAALDRGYHAARAAAAPALLAERPSPPLPPSQPPQQPSPPSSPSQLPAAAHQPPPQDRDRAQSQERGRALRRPPRPPPLSGCGSGPLSPTSSPGTTDSPQEKGVGRTASKEKSPPDGTGRPSALSGGALPAPFMAAAHGAPPPQQQVPYMVPYAPYPNVELQPVPYAHHHPHHGGAAYGGAGPFGGGDPYMYGYSPPISYAPSVASHNSFGHRSGASSPVMSSDAGSIPPFQLGHGGGGTPGYETQSPGYGGTPGGGTPGGYGDGTPASSPPGSSCGDGASFSGSTQPRSHSWGAQHRGGGGGGGGGGSSYGRWESPGGGRVPSDPALALLGGHAPPLSHTRHRAPSDPSHMYKRGEGSRSRSSTADHAPSSSSGGAAPHVSGAAHSVASPWTAARLGLHALPHTCVPFGPPLAKHDAALQLWYRTAADGGQGQYQQPEPRLDQLEAAALTQRANGAVTGLCRSGRYDEARELLHLLQCAGGAGAPLRLAFMAVIKGLKAARRWSDAFGALAQLRSAGLTPPLQACNMVLDACGKAGQLPHVFAVLQCLHECGVPPDTVTVTSLVDACGRAGALDHAREAWAWMRACGVRPNTYTFNAMIHTYAKAGALDHARAMLAEMETAPGCEPSTSTFTSIISACGRAGDTAQAFALYDEMERRGVPANSATFTTLIAACGATGDAARAFAAMKRMEALKLPPNLYTYNSLISCCARAVLVAARTAEEQAPAPGDGPAERLEAAFGVFDDMVRRGLQPDNFTFSSLINACAKAQQAERAFAVKARMAAQALVPNTATYTSLIDCCCRVGRLEDALHLLAEMRGKTCSRTRRRSPASSTASARRGASTTPSACSRRCSSARSRRTSRRSPRCSRRACTRPTPSARRTRYR